MDSLVFDDIVPIEIPVRIKGEDYVLKEATESAAARYKNAQLKAMKRSESADGSSVTNLDGMAETEALLLSLCLFKKTETGWVTVDINFIKSLVRRITGPLFDKAEEISGLKKKPKTEEELIKTINDAKSELTKLRTLKASGQDLSLEPEVKN